MFRGCKQQHPAKTHIKPTTASKRHITTKKPKKLKKHPHKVIFQCPTSFTTTSSSLLTTFSQAFSNTSHTKHHKIPKKLFTTNFTLPSSILPVLTTPTRQISFFNSHKIKQTVKDFENTYDNFQGKLKHDYFNPFQANRGRADKSHSQTTSTRRDTVNKKKRSYDDSESEEEHDNESARQGSRAYRKTMEIGGTVPLIHRLKKLFLITGAVVAGLAGIVLLFKFAIFALQVGIAYLVCRTIYRSAIGYYVRHGDISTALLIETFGESHKNDSPFYAAAWKLNPINWFHKMQNYVSRQRRNYERKLELQHKLVQCLQQDKRMVEMFGEDYIIGNISNMFGEYGLEGEVMIYDGYISVPIYSSDQSTIDISAGTKKQKSDEEELEFETPAKRVEYIHEKVVKRMKAKYGEDHSPEAGQYNDLFKEEEDKLKNSINAFTDAGYEYKLYEEPSSIYKQTLAPEQFEAFIEEKRRVFFEEPNKKRRVSSLDFNHASFNWNQNKWRYRETNGVYEKLKSYEGPLRPRDDSLREIGVVYCFYNSKAKAVDIDMDGMDPEEMARKLAEGEKPKVKVNLYDMIFNASKPYEMLKVLAISEQDTIDHSSAGTRKRSMDKPHKILFNKTPDAEDLMMHGIQIDPSTFEEVKWQSSPQVYKDRTLDRYRFNQSDQMASKVTDDYIKSTFPIMGTDISTNNDVEYNNFNLYTASNKKVFKNELDFDLNERYVDMAPPPRRDAETADNSANFVEAEIVEAEIVEAEVVEAEVVQDNTNQYRNTTFYHDNVSAASNSSNGKKPFSFGKM